MTVSQIHSDTAIFFLCLPFFCGKIIPNRSLDRLQQRRVRRGNQHNALLHFKRRLVLMKTTYRFMKNNVSFYEKQRVVLMKTTCRFMKNNGLFSVNVRRQKTIYKPPIKNRVFRSVKIPIITPSRAYAYARTTRVFAFLLSQVSHPNHNMLYFRLLRITWTYFNKHRL